MLNQAQATQIESRSSKWVWGIWTIVVRKHNLEGFITGKIEDFISVSVFLLFLEFRSFIQDAWRALNSNCNNHLPLCFCAVTLEGWATKYILKKPYLPQKFITILIYLVLFNEHLILDYDNLAQHVSRYIIINSSPHKYVTKFVFQFEIKDHSN